MMEKKIKCIHCDSELILDCNDVCVSECTCGKISINNGVILEGVQGTDWVDVSPKLLNE